MVHALRRLASQTAIYGLSSVVGRFLNYLLVPLLTYGFAPEAYGVIAEFYAYMGFLAVVLTFGLETGYFRFRAAGTDPPSIVFATVLRFVLLINLSVAVLLVLWREPLAVLLQHPAHAEYIMLTAGILAFDAIGAVAFARLRAEQRALRFATIKLIEIGTNIGLTLFFVVVCRHAFDNDPYSLPGVLWRPEIGIGYVFIANVLASTLKLLLLLPQLWTGWRGFDPRLLRRLLRYSLPMVVIGLAGIVNEMLDRAALKYLLPYDIETNMAQLGIYSASYKLSILMVLFIQAFRYAGEPFFFSQARRADARASYALILNWFVAFCVFIFLLVTLYLEIFQYFIGEPFRVGLVVVPVLLFANLLFGIYINLSIWYKLTDHTLLGAVVALLGAAVTIVSLWLLVPHYGLLGAAWSHVLCYTLMVALSYGLGRRYYPVPYAVRRILGYLTFGLLLYVIDGLLVPLGQPWWWHATLLLVLYLVVVLVQDGRELRFRTVLAPAHAVSSPSPVLAVGARPQENNSVSTIPLQPVILSGGSGSRLWPLSREAYPKQFLPLTSQHTMLQETLCRLDDLSVEHPPLTLLDPLIVCNEAHRFLVAEQLRLLKRTPAAILLEPMGRNTAPALTLAALHATQAKADPVLLVMPADHTMIDTKGFRAAIAQGHALASTGAVVTFGIVPTKPETGYGYLRQGAAYQGAYRLDGFVEKPDQTRASEYLASGAYLWNSGLFMLRASRWLELIETYRADIRTAATAAWTAGQPMGEFLSIDAAQFATCPSNSIDYAVMEPLAKAKTDPPVLLIRLDVGWSDVGAWSALWEVRERDEAGNVLEGDAFVHDSTNNLLLAQHRMLAAVGVNGLIVIETPDAVLVADRERAQDVKVVTQFLSASQRNEHQHHQRVHRPWGAFQAIDHGQRYQVKRLTVKPGESLSMQMHHHRAEHWIVVSGTARVTCEDQVYLLTENQSTYIPVGARHRLENPGAIELEIIEVQSGSYLGEDDIVRFDDRYQRNAKS